MVCPLLHEFGEPALEKLEGVVGGVVVVGEGAAVPGVSVELLAAV